MADPIKILFQSRLVWARNHILDVGTHWRHLANTIESVWLRSQYAQGDSDNFISSMPAGFRHHLVVKNSLEMVCFSAV